MRLLVLAGAGDADHGPVAVAVSTGHFLEVEDVVHNDCGFEGE